ncbi:MAG: DUF1552 domain-containing protein [Planctomycetota bacterium]|nr:DUF1552 domain-containing protein [Planctomycetota bacterium]
MRHSIARRRFLSAAGVSIALPMLESMVPIARADQSKPVKRFVCMSNNYGVYREAFFPEVDDKGAGYKIPETLKPLAAHRNDFTVFSNLDHGNTIGHQGVPVLLSGVRPHLASYYQEGNISVDQKIAEYEGANTRFPSMTVRVNESNLVSFTRTGVQVPAIDLRGMFRALFIEDPAEKKATAAEKLKRQNSILDVVMDKAKDVEKDLSKRDQRKFAEYLEAVRSLEKKLELQEPWLDRPKPKTDVPEPQQGKGTETDLRAMVELMALAIQTDSTRAITLSSGFVNGDFGLSGGYHGFSHHGNRADHIDALKKIENNIMRQMAHLIELLKSQEDMINGGTLLDHTTVMFGCGMATGPHSTKNLPLVVAGGGFRHGEHKVYPDPESSHRIPAANLLLSILQNHGLEVERFGTSSGTLANFEWKQA